MRALLLSSSLIALGIGAPAMAQSGPSAEEPQVTQLPPVSVLATRTETRADEAPATVTVFTARDIETILATDIKDLVRFEPGVSVPTTPARFGAALGTSGRAGNEGFTIRGLGGDRVLIVVDGVRTPDSFAFGAQSVGRGGYADLNLMKSVEILRGPASALYGSDGVAGAVSFTTKDPSDLLRSGEDFGARARVGYNSADQGLTTAAAVAGRSGSLSGLIAWTGRDSEQTETQGTVSGEEIVPVTIGGITAPGYNYALRTQANPQEITSDAWLAKLVWDFAPNQSLRLTYDNYQMDMSAQVLSGRANRFVTAPPASATAVLNLLAADTTERERIGLDWRFEDKLGLDRGRVSAYVQDATTRQFSAEDRVGTDRTRDNHFNNEVYGYAADATKTLSFAGIEHRLTFGGDWSETTQEGIRDGTVPPAGETFPSSPFPKTNYTLAGLFLQDEISLLDGSLKIIPALRWDSYDLSTVSDPLYTGARADQSDDHLSPKIGVVWWSSPTFGLFANWAEGFKAPTPSQVNNGFSNLAFGYVSASNPDLAPETSRSFEVGLRTRDLPLFGGRFGGQIVAFQSDYQDFISQQVVSGSFTPADPAVYQFVNFTEVEINGLEAKADLFWDNGLSARFAAAYADGEITDPLGTRTLDTIDPIKVVLGLGYDDPTGRFGGQLIGTWSQAKDQADTDNLSCFTAGCYVGDDVTLVDATAYWNVNDQVTARIGVFNLFDETFSWWSDVRGVAQASAIKDAYTQPGHNIGLSLSLRY